MRSDEEPKPDKPLVNFDVVPASSELAIHAMRSYFSELQIRFPTGFDEGDTLSADADDFSEPAGCFVILAPQGGDREAVGCGGVRKLDEGVAEIKRMWLSPQYRGLGLGRSLLECLESHAGKLGYNVIRLDTNSTLREAIAMYESAGYRTIERYNDNPFAERWFEKRIASSGSTTVQS